MNRSKMQFLALALGVVLAVGSVPVLAQGGGGRPGGGGGGRPGGGGPGGGGPGGGFGRGGFGRGRGFSILRLTPPVQERLKLDATQKGKLEAIGQKLRKDGEGLFGQGSGDREAAMTKMRALGTKAEADALKILNPTQKKQYDAMKADASAFGGLGRSGGALLALTDLTPPQKTKLATLAKDAGAKRDKLFSGGAGGPGGGSAGGDRSAIFEKMRTMDEANQASIKKVLTPPQQKKFDAAVAASGRGRGGPGGPGGPGGGGPGRGGPGGGRPGGNRT